MEEGGARSCLRKLGDWPMGAPHWCSRLGLEPPLVNLSARQPQMMISIPQPKILSVLDLSCN